MAEPIRTHDVGETKRPAHKRRHRNWHIAAILTAVVTAAAGVGTVFDVWEKLAVFLGLQEDPAFVLAERTAKGDLARKIVDGMSQRLFWIRRYSGDADATFPADEQAEAWKHYNDSVIAWNESYLTNYFLAGQYFKADLLSQLRDINFIFLFTNACMNHIHYADLYPGDSGTCHFSGIRYTQYAFPPDHQYDRCRSLAPAVDAEAGGLHPNVAALDKTADHLDCLFSELLVTMSK